MDSITSFTLIFALIYAFVYILTSNSRRHQSLKLPPGPPPFPIIGNIHQLGPNPHQTLANLSETHGPLMHLKFGSVNTIVASSPEMAKQILQKHDNVLASRPIPNTTHAHNHAKFSIAWMSSNNSYWRIQRRICKDHMFSNQTLDSSRGLRREKMQKLREYVNECSENGQPVNIAEATFITALNMLSTSMFSMDFANFSSDSVQEFREAVNGLMQVHGTPNLADFFPVLKFIDLQGLVRKSRFYSGKLLGKFDEIIDQRLQSKESSSTKFVSNDILQKLLDINDIEFNKKDIIHLFMDLFLAGTDTTATTVEWAMTELIRHPEKMEKARNELQLVTSQKNGHLEESDIPKLPYLQAILKETFRLHPSGPLMLPHKAESEIEINGYVIPKDSQVIVNIYAIGRDAGIWANVHSFEPERFLDSKIETKGHDFKLIPFGSGRRICPAMPLANRVVPLMIATLIKDFDWKAVEGKMDMNEKFGLTLHKVVPLIAIPIPIKV